MKVLLVGDIKDRETVWIRSYTPEIRYSDRSPIPIMRPSDEPVDLDSIPSPGVVTYRVRPVIVGAYGGKTCTALVAMTDETAATISLAEYITALADACRAGCLS